jgi:UPF0755 protein
MIKKFVGLVILLAIATVLALGIATWSFVRSPVVADDLTFDVPPGATGYAVVRGLVERGVIADSPLWTPWLRLSRASRCLQAGSHQLVSGETPGALFRRLCRAADAPVRRVTLPEGLTIWHVADLLENEGLAQRAAFLRAVEDAALLAELHVPATSFEGYLFPDTYDFDLRAEPETIVRRLNARFAEVFAELEAAYPAAIAALASDFELDRHGIVTLASIVEREAAVAEERPRIAQVFLNRLKLGMPLQSDPTCVYNAIRYFETPTRDDCRDATSTYSTYVIPALPPGPIASPGAASLRAVLEPSGESDILYFVSMNDGSGRHAFSATLDEHNQNVRRFLR